MHDICCAKGSPRNENLNVVYPILINLFKSKMGECL